MDRFTRDTGIELEVRYASSTSLATALVEEGENSPADVYWSQEPGTLGLVGARGLLARLPAGDRRQGRRRASRRRSRRWVGTSGRSRVLVYNTQRAPRKASCPRSVWGLTNSRWKGKIGIAPTNASFQAFLGGDRLTCTARTRVRTWLRGLQTNDVRFYPNNTIVVQAVGRGDIQVGLVNHYYLYNLLADTPTCPVRNHWFRDGDPGNLVLAAGVGDRRVHDEERDGAAIRRLPPLEVGAALHRRAARGGRVPARSRALPRRPGLPALTAIKGPKYTLGRLSARSRAGRELLLEHGYIK